MYRRYLRPGAIRWADFPCCTWALVAVALAGYAYVCSQHGWGYALGLGQPDDRLLDFYERFGIVPLYVGHLPWAAWPGLLTGLFIHAGPVHLAFNMLFLRLFGAAVERDIGWRSLLTVFVMAGDLAALAHAAVFPASGLSLVGASGSVAGVMSFYLVWAGLSPMLSLGGGQLWLERPAFWYALVWLGAQLLGVATLVWSGGLEQVAVVPHWAGFALGIVMGWLWRRFRIEKEPVLANGFPSDYGARSET